MSARIDHRGALAGALVAALLAANCALPPASVDTGSGSGGGPSGGGTGGTPTGGTGGTPPCGVAWDETDPVCESCATSVCCGELNACSPGSNCYLWVECFSVNCATSEYPAECAAAFCATYESGIATYQNLVNCVCGACGACAATCPTA